LRSRLSFGAAGFIFGVNGERLALFCPTSTPQSVSPSLRILHLPKWYPNRYDDQDGDFVARHVAAITAHGGQGAEAVQSAVVFAAVARGPLPALVDREVDLEGAVPVWRYYYRARPTGVGPLDKGLKLCLWLGCALHGLRAARRHWGGAPPDLVHVHVLLRTGLLAWGLRIVQRWPYIVSEQWTRYLPERRATLGTPRRVLTGLVVRRAAALHTVSRALGEALAALGAQAPRAAVIANVVDTDLFRPVAQVVPGRLLHVAAFNESVKNLSGVLRVVAGLRPAWPHLRLRVVGYGPDEARLHAYATELGLLSDGTVEWVGKLPYAAVATEMQQATALVSFSRAETFGCVLLEARACGRPVVGVRAGSVPELFEPADTYGLLVASDDEPALAAALAAIISGQRVFDPAQLRADATARCAATAIGASFGQLYQQVLAPAT
jgi:starch synthase